jgi:hypothetical protein
MDFRSNPPKIVSTSESIRVVPPVKVDYQLRWVHIIWLGWLSGMPPSDVYAAGEHPQGHQWIRAGSLDDQGRPEFQLLK